MSTRECVDCFGTGRQQTFTTKGRFVDRKCAVCKGEGRYGVRRGVVLKSEMDRWLETRSQSRMELA